eukprot:gene5475-5710_t
MGMTPAKAKDTLRVWAELGAQDPEQLKQLLVKRSMQPLTALAIQSVLDLVACAGGFYVGKLSGQADFPGSILISLVGYFFACYYFLQDIVPDGSLANLSAYLTLQRAEEVYGFVPDQYGLTEAQAADIAGVFSQFDVNEDGRLEQSELRQLCRKLGTEISDAEAKEAIRILDSSNTGFIQFGDFVEWYIGLKPSREAKEQAANAQ